jgi:dihydroflavonol-4-reductase
MRIVVTGGAGFVGRALVGRLVERGDRVVALVRDPARADFLAGPAVDLVRSDLSDAAAMLPLMAGADALVHAAGSYRVGLRPSERPAMWEANVGTTERVLDAAQAATVPRIVYISTNNVLGDTYGTKPDESYRRPAGDGFLSWYDETKVRAEEAVEQRITAGAPVVIVRPGQVYGPHDHSDASAQLAAAHAGRLRYVALADLGLAWVHVDDVAAAVAQAVDRGRIGQAYSLAGDCRRMGESVALAARIGGHRPPGITVPTALLRLIAPVSDLIGHLPGLPPGLGEVVRAADGVTYWASHEKASRELGFMPRSLERGIPDTWGAAA